MRLVLTLILGLSSGRASASNEDRNNETRRRAQDLWEQMIDAKGGRRLTIKNAVLEQRSGRSRKLTTVELLVPPNHRWYWTNSIWPGHFMRAFDIDKDCYCQIERGVARPSMGRGLRDKVFGGVGNTAFQMLAAQVLHFAETTWVKPVPLSMRIERIGLRKFDVVRTSVGDELVDFWLDQKTHLPNRITFPIRELPVFDIKTYKNVHRLQLPETVVENWVGSGWTFHYDYELNVDYDPEVFTCPPRVRSDAWRRRSDRDGFRE